MLRTEDGLPYTALVAALDRDWGDPEIERIRQHFAGPSAVTRIEQLGFWTCQEVGLSLAFKDAVFMSSGGERCSLDGPLRLVGVHLYAEGYESFRGYTGALPRGVSLLVGRTAILASLGEPSLSGGGNYAVSKRWPYWDRFDLSGHSLRVQYADDRTTVTILTLVPPVGGWE